MKINGLSPNTATIAKNQLNPENKAGSTKSAFGNILKKAVNEVNQLHIQSEQAADKIAQGKEVDIHNTMIALEKADVSFQLMLQVRNKTLEAYQEILRMPV